MGGDGWIGLTSRKQPEGGSGDGGVGETNSPNSMVCTIKYVKQDSVQLGKALDLNLKFSVSRDRVQCSVVD